MGTKISAMNVGTVTSSTPFPAVVGSTTRQVTLEPVFNALSTIQTTLGTLQSTITSVAGSVTTLSGTVTTLSGTVSTMQTDISNLRSTVTDINSRLNGLTVSRTPFVPTDFGSWTNNASNSIVETITGDVVNYFMPSSTPNTAHSKTKALSTSTRTYTAQLRGNIWDSDFCGCGITFFESSSNKFATVSIDRATTTKIAVRKGTEPTTFTSVQATNPIGTRPNIFYFQVNVNTTGNLLSFRYSWNGVVFSTMFTESLNTFFTTKPDKVGLHMFNGSGGDIDMDLISWTESTS